MTDLTPNLPEVVAEVRARFERYEQALIDKDVAVLDATFWDSPHTIRYAMNEHGYGFAEIHAHRVARPPGWGRVGAYCSREGLWRSSRVALSWIAGWGSPPTIVPARLLTERSEPERLLPAPMFSTLAPGGHSSATQWAKLATAAGGAGSART